MQITTERFGVVESTDEEILTVDGGILGFASSTRFLPISVPDADGWIWLQSLDEPELAFLAVSAFRFFPGYDFELADADAETIELDSEIDAEVFALVTVHRDGDDITDLTANLLGPVVVNRKTNRGRQVVLAESAYSTREPLGS